MVDPIDGGALDFAERNAGREAGDGERAGCGLKLGIRDIGDDIGRIACDVDSATPGSATAAALMIGR